jgi:hypothetical protein
MVLFRSDQKFVIPFVWTFPRTYSIVWLTLLDVAGEVVIHHRVGPTRLKLRQHLGSHPAAGKV